MNRCERKAKVNKKHSLPVSRQCKILDISRSSAYRLPSQVNDEDLALMKKIDVFHLRHPFKGSRRLRDDLWDQHGLIVNRKKVRRLMRKMGIRAVFPGSKTTHRNKQHKVYPYLLRNLDIHRANQVWCTDITYIPMCKGFLYLVVVMDWYTRKALTWRLSNSLDTTPCVEALEEAIEEYGKPDIFNSDQGCQFTSEEFTSVLKEHQIKISMDGKGRWMDNVFIERLWRSLKYEEVYLRAYENVREAQQRIDDWLMFYNEERRHMSLNRLTPNQMYYNLPSGLPMVA